MEELGPPNSASENFPVSRWTSKGGGPGPKYLDIFDTKMVEIV